MKPKNVDEYIAQAPQDVQEKLKALRATILAAVPSAEERISYGMPHYHYKGRLVYFSLWKKHIGVYGISAAVLDGHKAEVKDYVQAKGALQFPLDKEMPLDLIEKLVKAQAKMNDEVKRIN